MTALPTMEALDRRIEIDCGQPEVILPMCNGESEPFRFRSFFGCVNSAFDGTDTSPSLVFLESNLVVCCANGNLPYCRPRVVFRDEKGRFFDVLPYEVDGRREVSFEEFFNILRVASSTGKAVPDLNFVPRKDRLQVW